MGRGTVVALSAFGATGRDVSVSFAAALHAASLSCWVRVDAAEAGSADFLGAWAMVASSGRCATCPGVGWRNGVVDPDTESAVLEWRWREYVIQRAYTHSLSPAGSSESSASSRPSAIDSFTLGVSLWTTLI